MKRNFLGMGLGLALALAACGQKAGDVPQGQVVATVDGKEITVAQLNAEMTGLSGMPKDAAEREALQRLIVRRILLSEASKRGVDKQPEAAIASDQASSMAVVQLLADQFGKAVPKVSEDEAREYVRAHPSNFAQRELLFVDQLVASPAPAGFEKGLEPLHNLNDAEALLKQKNIPYRHVGSIIDTATIKNDEAAQIANVSQDDIYFIRSGDAVQVSSIIAKRSVPLNDDEAMKFAQTLLMRERVSSQVQAQLGEIVKQAKGRVMINPAYAGKAPDQFK